MGNNSTSAVSEMERGKWKNFGNILVTAEKSLPDVTIKCCELSLDQKEDSKWPKKTDTHSLEQRLCSQHKVTEQACLSNQPVH